MNFKNSIVVIDYSKNSDEASRFTKKQIKALRSDENLIFAYMSVGEAETYRYYFKNLDKGLLVKENKKWKENFLVKFWEPAWQRVILDSYLPKLVEAGFQGAYLDIVDAWERFKDQKNKAQQMADFVIKISKKAKVLNPNFKIVIQNGFHLIRYIKNKEEFLTSIYALGLEDIFFSGEHTHDNELSLTDWDLEGIKMYKGKKIFSIEYLKDRAKQKKYLELAKKYKFTPLCTDRMLRGEFFECDL